MRLFSKQKPSSMDMTIRYTFPNDASHARLVKHSKLLGFLYLLSVMLYMMFSPVSAHVLWLLIISVIGFFPGCYWLMGAVMCAKSGIRLTETAYQEGPVRILRHSRLSLIITGIAFAADIVFTMVNHAFYLQVLGLFALLMGTVCALLGFKIAHSIVPTIQPAGKKRK